MAFVRDGDSGVSQIMGTLLGVPIIGIKIFGGLYWVSQILGNYQFGAYEKPLRLHDG